jgi:hypothetical protein
MEDLKPPVPKITEAKEEKAQPSSERPQLKQEA